jgi:hypothetical protein
MAKFAFLLVFAVVAVTSCSAQQNNGAVFVIIDGDEHVGVVTGNTVNFHKCNENETYRRSDDEWEEAPDKAFELPNGYKSVFRFDDIFDGGLGVVTGNTVRFYEYDHGWEEVPELAFELPNGYKSVFGLTNYVLGVVTGNTIKFYDHGREWEEAPEADFKLPNKYKSVFGFTDYVLGVVTGNTIKGSNHDGREWEEVP